GGAFCADGVGAASAQRRAASPRQGAAIVAHTRRRIAVLHLLTNIAWFAPFTRARTLAGTRPSARVWPAMICAVVFTIEPTRDADNAAETPFSPIAAAASTAVSDTPRRVSRCCSSLRARLTRLRTVLSWRPSWHAASALLWFS